jgi:hypothetical protein
MLKDIVEESFDGLAVAIVHELGDEMEMVYNVYAINYSKDTLDSVLVTSSGSGRVNGEDKKTSDLRHFLETIEPLSYVKIEPIPETLFVLNNAYWISFYVAGKIFERKFIFKENTITENSLETVSLINKPGILLT